MVVTDIHFPSGEYRSAITVADHSATQASRGLSVSSNAAGLPPPRFWCTRYRYRKIPYSTKGIVKPSLAVPNRAAVSLLVAYTVYAIRVDEVTTPIIWSRRYGVCH